MAKLHAAQRNKLPASEFGEPGERKYPMPDASHAANAKARAKQQEEKGRLSEGEYDHIVAKANRKLGQKKKIAHALTGGHRGNSHVTHERAKGRERDGYDHGAYRDRDNDGDSY